VKYRLRNEKIFGPKREKLMGHWRKMVNSDFVTCTPHEIREDEIGRSCGTYRGK
jgi:hypothetical protein